MDDTQSLPRLLQNNKGSVLDQVDDVQSLPGLPWNILKKNMIDYTIVDKHWLLFGESYDIYMPERIFGHLSDILYERFPEDMKETSSGGIKRPILKPLYKIPLVKTDVHANSTLQLDSTKIDETGLIIEHQLQTTGCKASAFRNRTILGGADLGSHLKVSSPKKPKHPRLIILG